MYTITKGESRNYARAYVIRTRNGERVYVGNLNTLTKRRKADVVRHLASVDSITIPLGASDSDLASLFDRSPFCRLDNLEMTLTTCTNEHDANDVRVTWCYSDSNGGGQWELETTVFATVN